MGGNKSRSWLYQGAQGGVRVALSALFKQQIGAFRHFLGPFPGSIPQAMGHKPKKRGTNGPQGDAIGHCMALRALWSAFLRHFHDSQWASRSVSGLSTRAGPPFPPADSVRAHRTRHAVFIWFISALLLDQQALVATARSASQHIAHRTWHQRMVPRSPQYIYRS